MRVLVVAARNASDGKRREVPRPHPTRAAVPCGRATRDHGANRCRRSSMKVAVTDPALLSAVRPLDLSAYLRAHGWRPLLSRPDNELADWKTDSEQGRAEVSVPRHNRWRAYPRRVREVIAELSRVEGRSE